MAARRLDIFWRGDLVGWIEDPSADQFHWYGRWAPCAGPMTDAFHAAVNDAMARWDETSAGTDVHFGDDRLVAEVVAFDGSEIEILANPARWD